MHDQARAWVERWAPQVHPTRVLEIGSRNLNGGVRDLFPGSTYWGIDFYEGPDVDEVADARIWTPPEMYDLVVCTEVLEHVELWPLIVRTAAISLHPGGNAIFTMATDPRPAHSGLIADELQEGEYYGNVDPSELASQLSHRFTDWTMDYLRDPGDLRVWATR